jgi:hypothetical protein
VTPLVLQTARAMLQEVRTAALPYCCSRGCLVGAQTGARKPRPIMDRTNNPIHASFETRDGRGPNQLFMLVWEGRSTQHRLIPVLPGGKNPAIVLD